MDDPWLDAATHYSTLDERARHDYWQKLTTEQRVALTSALSSSSPTPIQVPARRATVLQTLAVFSGSFFMGGVLVIVLQVMAIGSLVDGIFGGSNSGYSYDQGYGTSVPGSAEVDCSGPNWQDYQHCVTQYNTEWMRNRRMLDELGRP